MSAVAIARALLVSNAPLVAVVPAARIMAGVLPLNTVVPAISVMSAGANPRLDVKMGSTAHQMTERVQVTLLAASYATQKSILALIKAACPHTRGSIGGFNCDSVLPDTEGPDIQDTDAGHYIQSIDLIIKFNP